MPEGTFKARHSRFDHGWISGRGPADAMIQYIKNILFFPKLVVKHWELLWSFVQRELKARYEGSLLGLLWPVIQPLVLFAVYYMVFAKLLKIPVSVDLNPWGDINSAMEGAAAGWRGTFFLISGILPWIFMAEALNRCTGIVLENANLIKKIAFPSEFLPIYVVLLQFIYFFIGMVLFLVIVWCVNGSLPWLIVYIPLLILLEMIFVVGLGMLAGALNIFIRDVAQVIPLFTMFWMFVSPVFYSPAVLILVGTPPQASLVRAIQPYLPLNPMYNLLTCYRDIFKYGRRTTIVDTLCDDNGRIIEYIQEHTFDQGISTDCLLIFAAQAVITFIIGYAFFLRSKGRFADEV
jgi:lipopolysaccharide transport system permease protein